MISNAIEIPDMIELTKVISAGFGALLLTSINLTEFVNVSYAVQEVLQVAVLLATLIYTVQKIHDIKKKKDDRKIDH